MLKEFFNIAECQLYQKTCTCCEFKSGNWIGLTPLEDPTSYMQFLCEAPLMGGAKVTCKWNPVENGECPSRPLDCKMYPLSPASLVDVHGFDRIEFWVCTKCPLYEKHPDVLKEFAVKWAGILKLVRQKKTLDTWYRNVTPLMVGYKYFCTVNQGELVVSIKGRLVGIKTTALRSETVYGEIEKPPEAGQPFTVIAPALEGEGIRVVTTSDVTSVTYCITDRSYQFTTRSGSEYRWDSIDG